MRLLRTVPWVVLTAAVVAFVMLNLDKARVRFWPLENGDSLGLDWPVGFIGLFFFLLGLVPMWLLHAAWRWRATRKIARLETLLDRPSASLSTTQLDAASPADETPAN